MDSDDDDDMADLFSFGSDASTTTPATAPSGGDGTPAVAPPKSTTTVGAPTKSNTTSNATSELDELFQDSSDDSFLKLLDEQPLKLPTNNNNNTTATTTPTASDAMNDQETQDILNWLEEDDTDADALLAAVADESAQKATEQQKQKELLQQSKQEEETSAVIVAPAPAPPPAPTFTSLEDALKSPEATKLQILEQWEQSESSTLKDAKLRPLLWSRIICHNKSIDELSSSSLADSFQAFEFPSNSQTEELEAWIRTESAKLAPRIVRTSPNGMTVNEAEEALQSILLYHYHNNNNNNSQGSDTTTANDDNNNPESNSTSTPQTHHHHHPTDHDPLLPPVVCAILSAGVPKLATPVLMSHMVPSFMPFVALNPEERWEASKLLHSQFYLLACYHLPMLVYHLDRYVPGWYWPQRHPQQPQQQQQSSSQPADEKENHNGNNNNGDNDNATTATFKGRHLKDQGVIPPSWLMTHLVGECGGTFLDPNRLLQLLDLVFTNENNSLRFFLVLAVLEQHADSWLELTGDALMDSLLQNMQDSSRMTMEEWHARARSMKQATPDSVVDRLRTAEDEAVREALKKRQEKAEAALKARLEAEAKAHQEAQERKAEEARTRLTRARLVAYYRRFNPTKEGNIDKIMDTYKDRFDELDKKLKKKYGVGFNPALNPNKKKKTMTEAANESMKKTMQSMNEGMKKMTTSSFRKADNPLNEDENSDEIRKKEHRVSVSVKVGETLPYICMSREQANDIRRVCLQKDLPMPLRFYLVDCRSEETAQKQGRFPTAATLSPETLMDPELLQQYEDSFEAVRGSFHICVMGEGYSAIPALYSQKLTPALEDYMRQDESRTNNCALFFVKRGFPFVSVLEGGFASAHAWLVREGPKKGFDIKSLLVDYNTDVSLFGQMEKIRMEQKGQAVYKTQRALHNLLENSLASIVRNKMVMEGSFAEEVEATAAANAKAKENAESLTKSAPIQRKTSGDTGAVTAGFSSFFGRRQQVAAADNKGTTGTTEAPKEEAPKAPTNVTAPTAAPATQNRFSKWRQAAATVINASDETAQPSAPAASQPGAKAQPTAPANRFGGLGGLLNRSASHDDPNNQTQAGPLRRNPFARFGGGAAAATTTPNSGFGGFMKAAPGFGRNNASAENSANQSNATKEPQQQTPSATIVQLPPKPDVAGAGEESISFDTGSSESNSEAKKAEPNLRAV